MNCQDFQNALPDMLGTASGELPADFHEHLESCGECAAAYRSSKGLWGQLGEDARAIHVPSRALRDEFEAKVRRSEAPGRLRLVDRWSTRASLLRVAASIALLAVGFAMGSATKSADAPREAEDYLHLQNRLVRAQLELPRPTARLEAIQETYGMQTLHDDIVGALLSAVRNDPNVNVRLAAIDALQRFADQGNVRSGLEQSVTRQTSPLIENTLLEILER